MSGTFVSYKDIDDCLGPHASRFFGQGFRRVGRALHDLTIHPAPAGGTVTAAADVRYPADWSVKDAADAPRPHLSTIDALTLAVQVAEAYLAHAFSLGGRERRGAWLRSCVMRAGTAPQEDLADVAVHATARYTLPSLGGLRAAVTVFDVRVGTIRVSLDVEHDVSGPAIERGWWPDAADLLGPAAERYYGEGFLTRVQRITEVALDLPGGSVSALVRVDAERVGQEGGFGTEYAPSLSMVDAIVVIAQLAQTLMYETDGVERARTGTLWMRRAAMHAKTPYQPLGNPFMASTHVVRRKRLERGGLKWCLYDMDGLFQGIETKCSLAFTVPG